MSKFDPKKWAQEVKAAGECLVCQWAGEKSDAWKALEKIVAVRGEGRLPSWPDIAAVIKSEYGLEIKPKSLSHHFRTHV